MTLPDDLPGIAVAHGVRRFSGNAALYLSLLDDFRREQLQLTDRLHALIAAGERRGAAALLHELKGTAATLGAARLSSAAAAVEASVRAADGAPSLSDLATAFAEFATSAERLTGAATEGAALPQQAERVDTNQRRLLVVDDQPANINVITEAVRGEFDVLSANDGAAALDLAQRGGIDLILLDVEMPGMSGFDVCRTLKESETTRDIPVIFVTAREEDESETLGFDLGAADYITKPIRPAIVRRRARMQIELSDARAALQRLAETDALTGLANRRHFDASIDAEWQRAARNARPITLALIDIDFFKRFNDTYGHGSGDGCLRDVALAIGSVARRPGDLVARYGGEEFAILLPETRFDAACQVMAALLERVRELRIEHAASDCAPHVTISVGAIAVVPRESAFVEALATADKLLYEAKRGGRNRSLVLDAASGERSEITN
jgi:diguanylate cyclase (GGDEF)-like protein